MNPRKSKSRYESCCDFIAQQVALSRQSQQAVLVLGSTSLNQLSDYGLLRCAKGAFDLTDSQPIASQTKEYLFRDKLLLCEDFLALDWKRSFT